MPTAPQPGRRTIAARTSAGAAATLDPAPGTGTPCQGVSRRRPFGPMVVRAAGVVGRALLVGGVLVLLFVAYQLWGTGLSTSRAQSRLGAELAHELPQGAAKARAAAERSAERRHATTERTAPNFRPSLAPTEADPAEGQPVGTIDIPSIGLNMVIVEGTAASDLAMGPGHYAGTSLPGEAGNAAIAGHRTTYRHPFYNLTAVAVGDPIVITTPQGVFTYVTLSESAVAPTDVAVIAKTSSPMLTLTTCNPRYSAAQRLVLRAALARSVILAKPHSGTTGPTGKAATTSQPGRSSPPSRRRSPPPTTATIGADLVAAAWGLAAAAVALAAWLLGRSRRQRLWRWIAGAGGTVGVLALLWFFFGAIGPLLPPSF